MKVLKAKFTRANKKIAEGEKIAHALNERVQAQTRTMQAQKDALARLASANAQDNVIGDDMKQQLLQARVIAKNHETDANALKRKLEIIRLRHPRLFSVMLTEMGTLMYCVACMANHLFVI